MLIFPKYKILGKFSQKSYLIFQNIWLVVCFDSFIKKRIVNMIQDTFILINKQEVEPIR